MELISAQKCDMQRNTGTLVDKHFGCIYLCAHIWHLSLTCLQLTQDHYWSNFPIDAVIIFSL